jgi:hypothetical protein
MMNNALEKARGAIKYTIGMDAVEGYEMHPKSVELLLEALATIDAEQMRSAVNIVSANLDELCDYPPIDAEKPSEDALALAIDIFSKAYDWAIYPADIARMFEQFAIEYHKRECGKCVK